jgi:rhodanese-related sulfurtransferase
VTPVPYTRTAPEQHLLESPVDVPEIDIAEAARRHAAGTPVIDVREPDEYVDGHVPGAPLIPLATVPDRVAEVPATGEVLIICKSGGRSKRAAEFLREQGVDAVNIAGGTSAWIDAGHRVVTGDEAGA